LAASRACAIAGSRGSPSRWTFEETHLAGCPARCSHRQKHGGWRCSQFVPRVSAMHVSFLSLFVRPSHANYLAVLGVSHCPFLFRSVFAKLHAAELRCIKWQRAVIKNPKNSFHGGELQRLGRTMRTSSFLAIFFCLSVLEFGFAINMSDERFLKRLRFNYKHGNDDTTASTSGIDNDAMRASVSRTHAAHIYGFPIFPTKKGHYKPYANGLKVF